MATVAANRDMKALFINPRISRRELGNILIEVCGEQVDSQGQNLIRLLAQNRRLPERFGARSPVLTWSLQALAPRLPTGGVAF